MIEWAMIKWRGGGLSYRTGQGLSGTDSELELWEELAAEIARLREQLAAADVKLSDAGHDLRKRDAAIASLREQLAEATTRAETAEARVAVLRDAIFRLAHGDQSGRAFANKVLANSAGQGDQA